MAFRRWRRRQVVAGNRYRSPVGIIEMLAVNVIDEAGIADADARLAGYASAEQVRADLRGDADVPLHRLEFRLVDDPDPRAVLAADDRLGPADVEAIDRRRERLDRASSHGPWTARTLSAIAGAPGVRAADLAPAAGRDRLAFKRDVPKLKELGLTHGLEIGYRLSPRGEAYLGAHGPARRS